MPLPSPRPRALTSFFIPALALLATSAIARAESLSTSFPTDPKLSYERFGLFIGIDHYSVLKNSDLDGCVNDALAYKRIFVDDRFNVQRYAVLTNEKATRAGISKALHELVEQVQIAHGKTDKPITVVITYSGHGSVVPRKENTGTLGPSDSSWVASDSDLDGTRNIRGEELFLVHSALRKLGAQVIMISDSCYSGTTYRGAEKSRGIQLSATATGPTDNAFTDLKQDATIPDNPAALTSQPGFVWYAACSDREKAFEAGIADSSQKHGRLSLVMSSLLLKATDTSYSGLFRQIAQEFTARGWTDQNPEFHTAAGKENELFFRGGFAPLHGEVRKIDAAAGTAEISLGQLHGLADGITVRFYANMEDAIARRDPIATGDITRTDAGSSTVKLSNAVPLSAWAIPDSVQMQDFKVAIDDAVPAPDWISAKLVELDKNKQLRLVPLSASPDVVVHCLAANQIGLYRGDILPPLAGAPAQAENPKPLRTLSQPENPTAYGEILATNLLYLARGHRLATLEHPPAAPRTPDAQKENLPSFSATIVVSDAAERGTIIPQLKEGDRFKINVRNNITRSVYITIFVIAPDGKVDVLYPAPGEDKVRLAPDSTLEIGRDGPFVATVDDPTKQSERTQLKIIVSDKSIDFTPLTIAPETGGRNVKALVGRSANGDTPLFEILRDAMHGGANTRGIVRPGIESDWGTLNLVFDVKRKN